MGEGGRLLQRRCHVIDDRPDERAPRLHAYLVALRWDAPDLLLEVEFTEPRQTQLNRATAPEEAQLHEQPGTVRHPCPIHRSPDQLQLLGGQGTTSGAALHLKVALGAHRRQRLVRDHLPPRRPHVQLLDVGQQPLRDAGPSAGYPLEQLHPPSQPRLGSKEIADHGKHMQLEAAQDVVGIDLVLRAVLLMPQPHQRLVGVGGGDGRVLESLLYTWVQPLLELGPTPGSLLASLAQGHQRVGAQIQPGWLAVVAIAQLEHYLAGLRDSGAQPLSVGTLEGALLGFAVNGFQPGIGECHEYMPLYVGRWDEAIMYAWVYIFLLDSSESLRGVVSPRSR